MKNALRVLVFLCGPLLFNARLGWGAAAKTPTKPEAQVTAAAKAAEPKVLSLAEIEQLQKKLHSGKELTVDFTQTIYRSLRKKTTKRLGKGYFNKPDHFRWSMNSPNKEDWIYNGKFLAHYIPAKKSVYKYQPSAAKGKDLQHLIDMVLNFSSLFSQYDLLEAKQEGSKVKLQLKPKTAGEIDSTDITLDLDKNFVTEIKLNMKGGNYTLFDFSKPSTAPIKASLFELPQGVKVEEVL